MTLHVPAGPRRRLAGLALAALSLLLAACADNPVTGRDQLFLISQAQEARIGAEQNPEVIREFGGVYGDPDLAAYVDRIGRRLATQTERPDLAFTFTVLDSDLVNAFALPGGYVYVTRGLLALANSEAELAAVLAHEIGHVTARHAAERYSQSALAQLGVGLLGVATGSRGIAELAGLGAQAVLSSYSRDQESEADGIGLRYLAGAGYDPGALAGFLRQMERESRLRARAEGGETAPVGFFSTHPRTADRAAAAVHAAAAAPGGVRNAAEYLARIDGLVYGESAETGTLRGRIYGNAAYGIAWEAPPGFRVRQSGGTVIAVGPADSRMLFETTAVAQDVPVGRYLTEFWGDGVPLEGVEHIDVNGLPGATGVARLSTPAGPRDVRLLAIAIAPDRLARFLFITRPETTNRLAEPLQRATYSVRPLSPAEAAAFRPRRIATVTVGPGDTVAGLARRMAVEDHPVARFLALNGLDDPDAPLAPGRRVKLVVR